MEEEKTIQEVAEATGKLADLLKEVTKFLTRVFGPGAEELGHIAQDWARYYRYKNLLAIQDKVSTIHKQRSIEGNTVKIPLRYAIPLIQGASEEDDESLQGMWASLIANSMDPEKRFTPKRIYTQILSSLEPIDVKVLQFFSNQGWKLFPQIEGGITVSKLVHSIGGSEEEIQFSLQNLARLGCIIDEFADSWNTPGSTTFGSRVTQARTTFRPSPLGFRLMAACGVNPYED
jgi:hypothetical protein